MNTETNESKKQIPIRRTRSGNLTLLKKIGEIPSNAKFGKVCSIIGNQVVVEVENDGEYLCSPAGTIISKKRNLSNLIAAGDNVWFLIADAASRTGSIIKINERQNIISRVDPSNTNREQIIAANVDSILIFFSAFDPELNTRMIDRYIIAARLGEVNPIICINKMDLVDKEYVDEYILIFDMYDIPYYLISALDNFGIEPLKLVLQNKETVISGPSGSGKSTFLNQLLGYEAQAVSEISERTNKGTHTTSFSKRYNLNGGGAIIDTPGLREFGIWDLRKDELALFFKEFEKYFHDCQFNDCTHTHEPNCAVKQAVESEIINEERYQNYLSIYDTLSN